MFYDSYDSYDTSKAKNIVSSWATLKPGNRKPECGTGIRNRKPESGIGNRNPESGIRNPETTNHRKQVLQTCENYFAQLLPVKNKRL